LSRLNDLIRQASEKDPALAADLQREVAALADRRSFGLNFERHVPEAVELPGRRVRRGDKVRILPARGNAPKKSDEKLWRVTTIKRDGDYVAAELIALADETDTATSAVEDLVVVAEFRDPIYPGLVSTGKVERGGDKPFHTVINAENYHALQLLMFTHRDKVDCIYIDPPYNTGARDWKYNNDYVEADDHYRHSKWLAFMERRLVLCRDLLSQSSSALIVTIDEREYLRLGLLLEQTFPEARIQIVSSVINRKGVVRTNELTRTNEFVFLVLLGAQKLVPERQMSSEKVRWASLRRFEDSSRRNGPQPRPDQFYPIYVGIASGRIENVGTSLPLGVDRSTVADLAGCHTLWPLKPDNTEMIWGLTPATLRKRLAEGFVKVVGGKKGKSPTLYYLTSGQVAEVASGELLVTGRDPDGSVVVTYATGKASLPTTQWDKESHNAQSNGTGLLSSVVPGRKFPFAKSIYAVEDVLRLVVGASPNAVIVDFFSGSGTTAHAVMRLNRQDGGRRQSILVTNNEVAADEQKALRKEDFRPGDSEWERWGICEHITKPRIRAAITGKTHDDEPIRGDYTFTDEFPMAEGFEANAEFFTLTYEAPLRVASNREFERIAPLLWIRAGSRGRRIDDISKGWDVAEKYGVIADFDRTDEFLHTLADHPMATHAYIVTDDDWLFESVCRDLPENIEPVRLYEAYLRNFEIEAGRGAR
jgi:adenine-specific DNA-methyltransferase